MTGDTVRTEQTTLVLGILSVLIAPMVGAHHGFAAHFDTDRYITLEAVVSSFEFVSPHSYLYLKTTNESGETASRWCELNAQTQLRRKGISQDSFSVGDQVVIHAFQARRDPLGCYIASVQLADGSVLTLKNRSGSSLYPSPAVTADTGVVGTWYPKGRGTAPRVGDFVTPEGQAALDAYDSRTQNPVLRCEPGSPLRAWMQPGTPVRISRDNGILRIHHEFMDVVRVVHLDMANHPEGTARTDIGHSVGRFEDAELVMETALFSAGVLLETAMSPYTGTNTTDLKLFERLRVDPDSGDLELTWTAEDPRYYAQPLSGTRTFSRADVELGGGPSGANGRRDFGIRFVSGCFRGNIFISARVNCFRGNISGSLGGEGRLGGEGSVEHGGSEGVPCVTVYKTSIITPSN